MTINVTIQQNGTLSGNYDEGEGVSNFSGTLGGSQDFTVLGFYSSNHCVLNSLTLSSAQVISVHEIPTAQGSITGVPISDFCLLVDGSTVSSCPIVT